MPNVVYPPEQILFLKNNYHAMSNAELATHLGIDSPRKVQELARRNAIKWRAENGAPQWRAPIQKTHTTRSGSPTM